MVSKYEWYLYGVQYTAKEFLTNRNRVVAEHTKGRQLYDDTIIWLKAQSDTTPYKIKVTHDYIEFRVDDLLHRIDGPAIIYRDGSQLWYLNGKQHRVGGPAIEVSGGKFWYIDGIQHREDGPAYESPYSNEWYLYGVKYTEEDYLRKCVALNKHPDRRKRIEAFLKMTNNVPATITPVCETLQNTVTSHTTSPTMMSTVVRKLKSFFN